MMATPSSLISNPSDCRRRCSACTKPVKAVTAGKPQLSGPEMALAFCTRRCGSSNRASQFIIEHLAQQLQFAQQIALPLRMGILIQPQPIRAQHMVQPVAETVADLFLPVRYSVLRTLRIEPAPFGRMQLAVVPCAPAGLQRLQAGGVLQQLIADGRDHCRPLAADMHVVALGALQERTQPAGQLAHLALATEGAVEYRTHAQRQPYIGRLPLRRQCGQQPVLAVALAVELADVLWLGAAELLDRHVRVFAVAMRPAFAVLARFAGSLCRIAETVIAQCALQAMDQTGGRL